jgi:His/Glu/Gln/Arg/opine family amino acid ABC transporter permease subunit
MEWDFGIWLVRGPYLLQGLWITLLIVAAVLLISAPLAFLVSIALSARSRLFRMPAATLSWLIRGVPPLIILFIAYFVLPLALNIRLEPIPAAICGFVLYNTFVFGEIIAGGLRSVPRGQHEAIATLGIPPLRAFRRIILPQAMPSIIPPYISYAMDMVKGTALAGAIGVMELVTRSSQAIIATNRPFEILLGVAVIYGLIDSFLIAAQLWSERHFAHKDRRKA